jgi:hypothetical protein
MSLLISQSASQGAAGLLQRKGSRAVPSNLTFAVPCPVSPPSCSGRGELLFHGNWIGIDQSRGFLLLPQQHPAFSKTSGEPTVFTPSRAIGRLSRGALQTTKATSGSEDGKTPGVVYSKEFGYSRKDIILIGAGLIGLGYAMYYGLIATGMEPGFAGNWVQMIIFLGICVGWISTYLFRVATKVGGAKP